MAKIIDGKQISAQVKDECKEKVAKENLEVTLAVIQVGNDPASTVYVGNKKKACEYIGIHSLSYELPEETSEEELLALVEKLNHDNTVHGILVQLPLPAHINEDKVIETICHSRQKQHCWKTNGDVNAERKCYGDNMPQPYEESEGSDETCRHINCGNRET